MISTDSILNVITTILALTSGRTINFSCLLFSWIASDTYIFAFMPFFIRIHLFNLANKEASTLLCAVVMQAGSGRTRKKCCEKHETKLYCFLSALQQNSREHNRGFFICFMIKITITSPGIR